MCLAFGKDLRFIVETPLPEILRELLEECFSTAISPATKGPPRGSGSAPIPIGLGPPPKAHPESRQAVVHHPPATVWRGGEALIFEVAGGAAWCLPDAGRGGLQIQGLAEEDFEDFISFALGPMLLELAQTRGWFAVHAAGIAVDGRGILLPGPSGCGKTTTFRGAYSCGLDVLSDDLVWLHRHGEGFVIAPLPRWLQRQKLPAPTVDAVPLTAIVSPTILPQAESRLRPVGVQECLDTLLTASGTISESLWRKRLEILLSAALSARRYRLEAGHRRKEVPPLLATLGATTPVGGPVQENDGFQSGGGSPGGGGGENGCNSA